MDVSRRMQIDRAIDTETGEFDMVMATQGEASDGHIISIEGLSYSEEVPLQVDHSNSATATVGSVSRIRRDVIEGQPVLRGVGRVRLTGDGPGLAQRRDLVDGIASGDIRGVSMRAHGTEATERRKLPKSHPAHVTRDESNPLRRYGVFFHSMDVIEQSIVGIPADKGAMIGRADATDVDAVREMWHDLAEACSRTEMDRAAEVIESLERSVTRLQDELRAATLPECEEPSDAPSIETVLESLSARVGIGRQRFHDDLGDALSETFRRITGRELK